MFGGLITAAQLLGTDGDELCRDRNHTLAATANTQRGLRAEGDLFNVSVFANLMENF